MTEIPGLKLIQWLVQGSRRCYGVNKASSVNSRELAWKDSVLNSLQSQADCSKHNSR